MFHGLGCWAETYVNDTVTGGLGTDQATAPATALAGENALPLVADPPVLPEHVTHLAAGHTDITSGHVGVGANVLAELGHEGHAEATDLVVGLALGVEVRATLATAHVQASEGVLEDLLEAQELEDGEVDGGVEPETTLVGAQGRVELHPVAAVDLGLVLVIFPDDAELQDPLGHGDDGEGLAVLGVLLEEGRAFNGGGQLWISLACVPSRFSCSGRQAGMNMERTVVGLLELGLVRKVRHGC